MRVVLIAFLTLIIMSPAHAKRHKRLHRKPSHVSDTILAAINKYDRTFVLMEEQNFIPAVQEIYDYYPSQSPAHVRGDFDGDGQEDDHITLGVSTYNGRMIVRFLLILDHKGALKVVSDSDLEWSILSKTTRIVINPSSTTKTVQSALNSHDSYLLLLEPIEKSTRRRYFKKAEPFKVERYLVGRVNYYYYDAIKTKIIRIPTLVPSNPN